jgi:DNA primase
VVVGWQSRLLYDPGKLTENEYSDYGFQRDEKGEWIVPPKYFTSPGMEKGRVLYNYTNARNYDYVVVTEGVFDAFSVGPCAVSLFGKAPTEAQMRLLKTYWERVIMLLDPGDADMEMERAMHELQRSVKVTVVTLQGTKDAGDLPREEVWRQIAEQIKQDEMKIGAAVNSFETPAMN